MTTALDQLVELIAAESGLELGGARESALEAALERELPGLDHAAALRAVRDPRSGAELLRRLCEAVAVHETFFFRQRQDLDAIDWTDLLATAHAAGSPRIRVWVAGCSTGEEAYTLAILASEALGGAEPPVEILASDLSSGAVLRAERGEYRARSMRAVDEDLRARYFATAGPMHRIGARLRGLVAFRQHNLVSDPAPGARFELVLCRNVLIYFNPRTAERVLSALERALTPGGTLLLGAADRLCVQPAPRPAPVKREAPNGRRPRRADGAPAWRRARRQPAATAAKASLAAATAAADAGRLDEALELTAAVLEADPLNAEAHFARGNIELGRDRQAAAVESLRRALYLDPSFALAAFQLGRAHDVMGDSTAAARAYRQALRTLTLDDREQRPAPDIDLADVAAACGARLAALES